MKSLSRNDAVSLLEIIYKSRHCISDNEFRALVDDLRKLIPFDFTISGVAKTDKLGAVIDYDIVNVNYDAEWLELYTVKGYYQIDPIVRENFLHFSLQRWTNTFIKYPIPRNFIFHAMDFGLKDGYTTGNRNPSGRRGSIFTISGDSIEFCSRSATIMELISPHMHEALLRIISRQIQNTFSELSEREKEILRWIGQGKTSWDIGLILGISVHTVNFHINNIMQKFDVTNRLHAVAIAVQLGLIDID
jgi:DNA-binding CsgD family transcriptional regulator